MPTWTCPGCGTPYSQDDPDLITSHVRDCDYVDGSGQVYPVTIQWSVTHWHAVTVQSSDLAAAANGRPFSDLTGRVLDPDDGDRAEVGLPAYLDELAADLDPETDGWKIRRLYDARLDRPRRPAA